MLHIKVNGKSLNIPQELAAYKKDKKNPIKIFPEDIITISGPMMVDGGKQSNHADISRQNTMNIRTRFFFEFTISEVYLTTKIIVPGKGSAYARKEFSGTSNTLQVK